MTKQNRYDADSFEDDAERAEFDAPTFSEDDIQDLCGKPNATVGQALYQRGLVAQRSFDGQVIHATIQDGHSNIPVVLDLQDESARCTDQRHLRTRAVFCEHIAALMWAFLREPESFIPQNIGGMLELLNQNPQAREHFGGTPQFDQVIDQFNRLPAAARAALNDLPLNATSEQLAQIAALNTPAEQLQALLRDLTPEQLRAIAQRRAWTLASDAKESQSAELAPLLIAAPLPAELSPDEEQLLRNENTLFGFQDQPTPYTLQNLWRVRAGGDLRRGDNAVRGLQTAGVLFPCTKQGALLHYHWSPFLRSADAPQLAPKTKFYPADKIDALKFAEPLLPLPLSVDAVLELAEREPLRMRPSQNDPRWAKEPFAPGWELDPQEMEQFAQRRYFSNNAITIAFPSFWETATQQKLDAIAPTVARWAAIFLFGGGVLKPDGAYARVDAELAKKWRAESEAERWKFLWLGFRAGYGGLTEIKFATERASLVAQRSPYAEDFQPIDLLAESASARNFITRLFALLDPLVWYSFNSFAEYVRGLRPDFLHTTTAADTWFLSAKKTQLRCDPHNPQHWDSAYRAVLAAYLETTLRWLGVIQVAYEGKDLAAFHITALGAALLAGGEIFSAPEPVDPNAPPLTWVDDATLRWRATTAAASTLPLLRSFADPAREPFTFHVTHASIARALEHGAVVAEIARQLLEAGAPLPAALRAQMDALAGNYGRAHLYEGLTVIELADDFALRELLASTSLSQFIVHQFSPRLIVVRDENVDAWVNEIIKKGYTPKLVQ